MKLSDMYPSKYLKAEDFGDDEVKIFTIKNIEIEELGKDKGKKEEKPVITFREPDAKALVLNKTNAAIIGKFYGDDTDDWLGKKIALHAIEVESFGDVVRAIRVKTKAPVAPKLVPLPAPEPDEDIFPDEPAAQIDVGNFGQGPQVPSKKKQPA